MESTARRIEATLRDALSPTELRVDDESHLHAGHAGAREGGHYRVFVVSAAFAGLGLLERHRKVYGLLGAEFRGSVHALAITARAPGEP
ncbi:MAG: BolA family protein [Polyangiales bacterium]